MGVLSMNPNSNIYSDKDKVLIYESILEASDDGFLAIDMNANILYINSTYCNQLGLSKEEIIGRPVVDIIKNSKLPDMLGDIGVLDEKDVFHFVVKDQFLDKQKYALVTRTTVVKDNNIIASGGQARFVKTTVMLGEKLKKMNEKLEFYKNELNRLSGDKHSFDRIIGSGDEFIKIKDIAKRAALQDFTVLLTGETGTGKEVFANAIHYASKRKDKPFIKVNCATIPSELFESEFFGYSEGAFTGAKKAGKKGKFEMANGGTIFLDEIAEMPVFMQVKLLRVLQEREIEKIGGEKPILIDIRVIAATNKDLKAEIEKGRFREDLYYRLNVVGIELPPLRKRKKDIVEFVHNFLNEINEEYRTAKVFSEELLEAFMKYSWPGNVRELENTVERCYTLAEENLITEACLNTSFLTNSKLQDYDEGKPLNEIMNSIEKKLICKAIEKNDNNIQKAAMSLGIHRRTLYKKIEQFGIKINR